MTPLLLRSTIYVTCAMRQPLKAGGGAGTESQTLVTTRYASATSCALSTVRSANHWKVTARCAEIVEWRRTGILKGTVLREFASARYGEEHDAIQRAENDTLQEAIELVTSMKAAS